MGGEIGFILHRARIADNVGGVARAMVNFGLSRLVLSDPATYHFDDRAAVRAEHVLEKAFLARSLEEAVAQFSFVIGTSSRKIKRLPALSPREAAAVLHERAAAGQTVAVLFGSENHGLVDEDLLRCDALCRIPTGEEQPSINLAQSASLIAYEIHVAGRRPQGPRALAEPATRDEIDRLEGFAKAALLDAGFLNPQQPDKVLTELRRLLVRAQPTRREVELCTAAVKQLQRVIAPVPQRPKPG